MSSKHFFICAIGLLAYYVANSVAIIGGGRAGFSQFRYPISLRLNGQHKCGGAVIGNLFILTAAHCVLTEYNNFRGSLMSVVAGAIDLNDITSSTTVNVPVAKIYVPVEFNPLFKNYTGDIAVLKLKYPLQFHKHSHILFVKPARNIQEKIFHNEFKIAGFGRDGNGHLQWAAANLITNTQCQSEHPDLIINNNQICAKIKQYSHVHRGVCIGDSGSPLVYSNVAYGILSIIPADCSDRIKSPIYTRVSSYVDFISYAINDTPRLDIRTLELRQ